MRTFEIGLRAAAADKKILKGLATDGDASSTTDGDADVGGSSGALDDLFAS